MMEEFIDTASKAISFIVLIVGIWWAVVKFLKRDEHFPHIFFEVTANFVGTQNNQILFEVLALLENKGVVPIKIKDLNFKVRGLREHDSFEKGDETVRGQIKIPHILLEGSWIPSDWQHTFIYPGVRTEYNYIAAIPQNISFIRVEGSFSYERGGRLHHAAKLLKVPNRPAEKRETVINN